MKRFKRCAFCGGRIWGVPRFYAHMFGDTLVLQCWTHDSTKAGRKGCDQLLSERITKGYVDTKDIAAAVGPFLRFDTRKTEGLLIEREEKRA